MKKIISVILLGLHLASAEATYPFELPEKLEATIEIDSTKKSPVNPLVLGLNCNWPENLYGKIGYNHPDAQKLIRTLKPISLRFPHGVWANFYDWESDGRRMTDNYKTPYDSAVKDHPDLKYGFDGLHALHQDLKFDVIFTYNVNYDSPEKGARRLQDRKAKGFGIERIELGNEIFWKTQRSTAVSDVEKYIAVAKAHATALRKVSPGVKISVPAHWRKPTTDAWNAAIKGESFYDAITVHKHITKKETPEGIAETLGIRKEFREMTQALNQVFPGKPIWLTEWSVGCGENAASILGLADAYMGFFENPGQFAIADFFQINASHPLINYNKKTKTHTRTSYGAAYKIIRGVFENSQRLESKTTSTKITDNFNAVSAEAVIKDGKLIVFALNKTNAPIPFRLVIDGKPLKQATKHRTLSFPDFNKLPTFEMDQAILSEVKPSQDNTIILPPLSLNRIDK